MISNIKNFSSNTILNADICIVGGGAAGISIALSLAGKGLKIVMLESGFYKKDKRTQSLYEGKVADEKLHSPPDKYRQRSWGGSTNIWGGRCMPFDPVDFEQRDYIPNSGWPIVYDDLEKYYIKANEILEAGPFEYDADKVFDSQYSAMLRNFKSEILKTNNLERFSCPTNLGKRYFKRISNADDIQVILGANCTQLMMSQDGSRIASVEVKSLDGQTLSVQATETILAMGGIETTRLLLASNQKKSNGIGNEYDQVGRYYQCHIAGNVGQLVINAPLTHVHHGYDISEEGVYCRRRLSINQNYQRVHKIANMIARLHFPKIVDPVHKNGVLSGLFLAKNFISYEYGKRLNDGQGSDILLYFKHMLNIITDPLDTTKFLYHWITKRTLAERKFPSVILRNKTNRFSLEVHSEQIPNPLSRITLTDELDALGMPKVMIDWKYLPEDIESVRKTLNIIAQELAASGIGTFTFDDSTLEYDLTRFGAYGGHHIGTTRMGNDPQTSVVDRNCKVHSVDNLYIASASVFPTSSQANPTLTIVAMSLRLADHISEVIGN